MLQQSMHNGKEVKNSLRDYCCLMNSVLVARDEGNTHPGTPSKVANLGPLQETVMEAQRGGVCWEVTVSVTAACRRYLYIPYLPALTPVKISSY